MAFEKFHVKLKLAYDRAFPNRKMTKTYHTRKPWLTEALKNSIKIKNKMYITYKKCSSSNNEMQYKNYKNKLTKLMKFAEKKYYQDKLDINKRNMKKTWGIIKEVIGKNKSNQAQLRFKSSDGKDITNKSVISEKFNDFFVNIGPTLARTFEKIKGSPEQYLVDRQLSSLFLKPVTTEEVGNIMASLKDSSPGHDEMKIGPIRSVLNYIEGPLTYVCNLSLNEGIFPDILKIANIIPLYKKYDPVFFNNYRPVSLLCSLSKVLEKLMYNRVISFLDDNNILFKYQFGFRKSHSTYLALTILMDKLIKSIENGDHVVGVYLDFSKAFDTVNHTILLTKLHHYGIRGQALNWFKSYLENRKQFVTYNNVRSTLKNMPCGVPQGSILGPLLFLIYINDLANLCKFTMPIFFADDSNLFLNGKNLDEIELKLNNELGQVVKWLKINKLTLNVKKTQCMVFTLRKDNRNVNIKIENQNIEQVCKAKFLGIIIDEQLNWKEHTLYISNKISKAIGVIVKARSLGKRALLSLYYSMIYPYLTYCCQIWGATYIYNMDRLHKLQKKAIRIICSENRFAHSGPLMKELGVLNVKNIYNYLAGQFMFRYVNKLLPNVFESYFTLSTSVHTYNTRQQSSFRLPYYRTDLGKRSVRYTGVKIWSEVLMTLTVHSQCSSIIWKDVCYRVSYVWIAQKWPHNHLFLLGTTPRLEIYWK